MLPPQHPKVCSLQRCPKCRFGDPLDGTWRGPVYKPGMDVHTRDRENRRIGEMLIYTCRGCGYVHEDPVEPF